MADDSGVWVKVFPDYAGGAPGAAVISGATGAVKNWSFVGDGTNGEDGQAYDGYEFLSSGELTIDTPGMVDVCLVGGGGAGGGSGPGAACGGGGAGGVVVAENVYVKNGQVTHGGGGSGAPSVNGATGNASALDEIVALGGGGGAAGYGTTGRGGVATGGGSGGGGGGYTFRNGASSMLPIQGNEGGTTDYTNGEYTGACGGGGASNAGAVNNGINGGAGGDGKDVTSFMGPDAAVIETVLLGPGGGGAADRGEGGAGGSGGGGTGGKGSANGGDAAELSGGGGGGGGGNHGSNTSGGSGGSGRIFVRVRVNNGQFGSWGDRKRTATPKTAHAARIENGVVRQVITIPHLNDDDNKITEYCNKIGLPGTWVDTSYTGARRGKYAGVGDLFDLNTRNAEFTSPVEVTE